MEGEVGIGSVTPATNQPPGIPLSCAPIVRTFPRRTLEVVDCNDVEGVEVMDELD